MDGFKRKITTSLQAQLSLWLSVLIIVAAISGGFFSFRGVFHEANKFQDGQLKHIADLMQQQEPRHAFFITYTIKDREYPESQIIVQTISATADKIRLYKEEVPLPELIENDFGTLKGKRHDWRIFVRSLASGERLIISQRTDIRNEIANASAWRTVFPFIVLIPALLILLNVVIRQMLKPVIRLSAELDARGDTDLSPLNDHDVPSEITSFTSSINALLRRVQKSMDTQKRFVADAAHELRSPLTALSLQVDNIRKTTLPEPAQARITDLRSGIMRMRTLLEQLLNMARSQQTVAHPVTTIPMEEVFKQVLEDLMPMVEAKALDIEVHAERSAVFTGQLFDALIAIKNLVDNAIRYTPEGGQILLRANTVQDWLIIEVEDSGPGIRENEMERIFDPFYRILGSGEIGSGLGLAIIKAIVHRTGAQITLHNRRNDHNDITGLLVTLRFPAPAQ